MSDAIVGFEPKVVAVNVHGRVWVGVDGDLDNPVFLVQVSREQLLDLIARQQASRDRGVLVTSLGVVIGALGASGDAALAGGNGYANQEGCGSAQIAPPGGEITLWWL